MYKERLVIKNFGPIKSVDLQLGKMTILIGEQATGKSTIAKVLAICRYFSYIVDCSLDQNEDSFISGLRYWDIDTYYNSESYINYECKDYNFEAKNCISKIIPTSVRFKDLLSELDRIKLSKKSSEDKEKSEWSNWTPDENFFRLNVKKVMDNPFFIPTERGLQSVFSLGRNINNLGDSLLEQLSQLSRIVKGFNAELKISSLDLFYKNDNGLGYTKKKNENDFYTLHNGASGYQSVIPIELVVYFYSKIERRNRTFIIEEPELNLFPKTQKKLMEFFVENINLNGHSFLLPTHSPYFLSSVNDLVLANKKGINSKNEVEAIGLRESFWLNPNDLSVYQLKDGEAFDIVNRETNLIGQNIIDDVSDEMNEIFENLLDIE
ncbi:MAG: AAA family ATPase [Limnohabitans sp.]|nr:AAA family ATPase [Limnohabitans sp.]